MRLNQLATDWAIAALGERNDEDYRKYLQLVFQALSQITPPDALYPAREVYQPSSTLRYA